MKVLVLPATVVLFLLGGSGCAIDEAEYCAFGFAQRLTNFEVVVDGEPIDPQEFGFVDRDAEVIMTSFSWVSDLNDRPTCTIYTFNLFEDETVYAPIDTDCID